MLNDVHSVIFIKREITEIATATPRRHGNKEPEVEGKGFGLARFSEERLILIGVLLGAVFWVFEAVLHVLVFNDSGILTQIFRPHSHEVWMRLTVMTMFAAFGLYSHRMVTARRRAEEAAMVANAELTQIFETAADGMRVVDRDFTVLRANETFSTISGIPKEAIVGEKCFEVFHGPHCDTPGCPMVQILDGRDRVEYDSEKLRRDGTLVPCIVTATPFRRPDGELIGIVEDFKDITERRESEQELMESRERLRELASHLQGVREEERTRISREIHDELGQVLTALKMDVDWLSLKLTGGKKEILEKTGAMSDLIRRTVQSVRRICTELRPGLLDDFGLLSAMEWQAAEFTKRTGIECEIASTREEIVMDPDRSTAVFRIFQEALTNVARHAEATRVEVRLSDRTGVLELVVRDDGKGLSETRSTGTKSLGLMGMRERAHSLGGSFTIHEGDSGGARIELSVPIADEKEGKG